MESIKLLVKRKNVKRETELPSYMSSYAAGMDVSADIEHSVVIEPGKYKIIPTGLAIALPPGYEAQIRPRSGLALKYGITILNSPGTIDADYRGEINILLINLGENRFEVKNGDRIAQLVVNKIEQVDIIEVDSLPESKRGINGFGSTGV